MTPQKILQVLNKYDEKLSAYYPRRIDADARNPIYSVVGSETINGADVLRRDQLCRHLHWMCHEATHFLKESLEQYPGGTQEKIEKAMRWLGFIQGCFFCLGHYALEGMKRDNAGEAASSDGE